MSKRYTTEEFIAKAKAVHGDRYDYSRVVYVDSVTPVSIICHEHGEFKQRPAMHLSGTGCPGCANERIRKALSDTRESFIEKARKVHGDKYDYSLVEYSGSDRKVRFMARFSRLRTGIFRVKSVLFAAASSVTRTGRRGFNISLTRRTLSTGTNMTIPRST